MRRYCGWLRIFHSRPPSRELSQPRAGETHRGNDSLFAPHRTRGHSLEKTGVPCCPIAQGWRLWASGRPRRTTMVVFTDGLCFVCRPCRIGCLPGDGGFVLNPAPRQNQGTGHAGVILKPGAGGLAFAFLEFIPGMLPWNASLECFPGMLSWTAFLACLCLSANVSLRLRNP